MQRAQSLMGLDACAVEPGRRFVTERGKKEKKKESRNVNPGLSAWVKRSLYRLQNVNHLPEDYIRMCLTFRSLAEFFNFGLVELQQYIYSIL